MPDREKVINGLECCKPHAYYGMSCKGCPYEPISLAEKKDCECFRSLHDDALSLLKEQEPVKPYRNKLYKTWHCGNCDGAICSSRSKFNNYCRNCGRKVKWDG